MTEIQIPINLTTGFILFGAVIVAVSIVGLFAVGATFFRTTADVTLYLLSWFFLFFGSLFIFIGIRRTKSA